MREWLNRTVSKTAEPQGSGGSNPPLSGVRFLFFWRDVRVVEGTRLESVCARKSTEGSNPSLSAIISYTRLTEVRIVDLSG